VSESIVPLIIAYSAGIIDSQGKSAWASQESRVDGDQRGTLGGVSKMRLGGLARG